MELNGHHRKWPTSGRRCARLERVLLVGGMVCVLSITLLLRAEVGGPGVAPGGEPWWPGEQPTARPPFRQMAMPAMKTIVAYSPEKQAELDHRPPIACDEPPPKPRKIKTEGSWSSVGDSGVSLYNGYYDDRIPLRPYVRVLAVTNGIPTEELTPLYCQTWAGDLDTSTSQEVEVVEATVTQIWWSEWDPGAPDTVTPLLISCPLSDLRKLPFHTAITAIPCSEDSPAVLVEPPRVESFERNFTVCVKDLNFADDISERLVEWFELLALLGAEKFEVYVGEVPRGVRAVLDHYSARGAVSVHRAPRARASSLWQRRRDHLIAYNDCLYRNLKTSRYVIPLDVDEVIVPRSVDSWNHLLGDLEKLENEAPGAASLAVSNVFFFDSFNKRDASLEEEFNVDVPSVKSYRLPHTLRHLRRSALVSPAPQYSKSFVSTARALTVFNHYALGALGGAARARGVPLSIALLHHYKASCRAALLDCRRYSAAWRRDARLLALPLARHLAANIDRVLEQI